MLERCGSLPSVAGALLCALAITATGCEQVEVVAIDVAVIEIQPTVLILAVGEQRPLSVELRDASGNRLNGWPIQWEVEDETVVEIDAGMLEGLAPGSTEVTARVNGIASSASVTVKEIPVIALAAAALAVDASLGHAPPAVPSIAVTNDGQGTLVNLSAAVAPAAGQEADWLRAVLTTTTAPTALNISIDHSGLEPGTYNTDIIVSSSDPDVAPVALPVELSVTVPPPLISLEATTITLEMTAGGPDPAPKSIPITNGGGGSLAGLGAAVNYPADEPVGWLAASLSPASAPASLTVFVNGTSLPVGEYHAIVDIVAPDAENSPQSVAVTLIVTTNPEIGLSVQSLDFEAPAGGPDPSPANVQITNTGDGTLTGVDATETYAGGQASGWLTLERSGSTAPLTLTVTAHSAGLAPGTYDATVVVSSPVATNSPRTFPVQLVVSAVPPEAPKNFDAHGLSESAIELSWEHDGSNTTRFEIELEESHEWIELVTLPSGTTSYIHSGLARDTRYKYRLRACNDGACSDWVQTDAKTRR